MFDWSLVSLMIKLGSLGGWLADKLFDCVFVCLIACLIVCLFGLMPDRLNERLVV